MTERLAAAALATIGSHDGVRLLAAGMSSSAWIGTANGADFVVRVPVGDGRRPTPDYAAESRLLDDLHRRGAPVALTRIVDVDRHRCAIARYIDGRPIEPGDWTDDVVRAVAGSLTIVHATPPELAVEPDIVCRFHLATIWPFDDTRLADHAVARVWPERIEPIEALRDAIIAAATGPTTVVHTDLHPQHLLVDPTSGSPRLAGLLDFGDAFAGVAAWDHACLRYYHGDDIEQRVTTAMGGAAPHRSVIDLIGVAWALYKLEKTPDRLDVRERVDRLLRV